MRQKSCTTIRFKYTLCDRFRIFLAWWNGQYFFLRLSLGLGIFLWRVLAQRVPVKLFITYGQTAWSMAWPPWHLRRAALHVIVTMLNDEQTSIPRNTFMIFGETLVWSDHWNVFVVFWKVLGFLLQGVYWSVSDSMRGMGMWLKLPVTPLASANWCKKFSDPVFVGHVSISLELTKRNSSRAKGRSSLCTESPRELEGMEYERTRSDWMECQRFISCQIL